MMHPDTELRWINDKIGYGVVATKLIPKGTITWVQDELDTVYPPDYPLKLKTLTKDLLEKYSFRNRNGEHILCWDFAKYVNHSFNSSCLSTAYNFEMAIKDIQPGEELTDDYGYLNLTESFVPEDEGSDRKAVHPDDVLNLYKIWDKDLSSLFPKINKIHQPLFDLLSEGIKDEIELIASGKKKMRSTRHLYFRPEKSGI
ncbi:SET domain-containing protein [Christiangramia salexigens]|uniref:SET domain-containing protein-lysine N-methyltransferase n=1 Tax=Christiangramia salexigens TaxID=1913577 RepID=A0A1L3J657_9FLAO|nr:SET domain-containing protein [Christiangramia salexigens]APG60580.1 SET domain-containing protein-lysine N-methyltransferase [Christiangramia salexigens]